MAHPCFLQWLMRRACCLLLVSMVSLPAGTVVAAGAVQAPLADLVSEYIDTEDGDKAGALLAEILRHAQADLETLEKILRNGRVYSTQPVGLQPGVPMRVHGR